jgi:hypothetical protein
MPHLYETDPQGYRPCDNEGCAGRGWIRCKTCKGEGSIQVESWDYSSSYRGRPRWRKKICKVCSGEGKIKCDVCNGTGSIARGERLKASNAELISGVASRHDERYFEEVRRHVKLLDDFEQAKREALSSIDAQLTHDSSDQTNTETTAKGNSARISLPDPPPLPPPLGFQRDRPSFLPDLFSDPPPLGFQRDRPSLLPDPPSYNPTLDELCEDFERFKQEAPRLRMSDFVYNRNNSERRLANLMRALRAELSKIEFRTIGVEEKLEKLKSAVDGENTPESVSSAIFHLWFQVAYAREVGVL